MLKASELPKKFWADATVNVAYISNILPTYTVREKTPHEFWFGVKPKISHLRVFRCVAFTHIPLQNLQKLDNRAVKGAFTKYYTDAKAYRIYLANTEKVLVSRHVRFVESETWKRPEMQKVSSSKISLQEKKEDTSTGNTFIGNSGNGESDGSDLAEGSSDNYSPMRQFEKTSESSVDESPLQRVKTLKELDESCSFALLVTDPSTYDKVVKFINYREAMANEIKAIEKKT